LHKTQNAVYHASPRCRRLAGIRISAGRLFARPVDKITPGNVVGDAAWPEIGPGWSD
jgi:hypothetical protein